MWPPEQSPRIWTYEPYPTSSPLIGKNYLMHIWRDAHHADAAAYREFHAKARFSLRLIDWLKYLSRSLLQWIQEFISPHEGDTENLPQQLQNRNEEQPLPQSRSKYVHRKLPKKWGEKLDCNWRDAETPEGWGLLFEENFRVHRLLFFILLIYVSSSLGIAIWLYKRYGLTGPGSLGSLISLLAWFASLFSLSVTVWFKWAENS